MEAQVFAPIVRELSHTDRLVLAAMSRLDEDEVGLRDVARVAGRTSSYVGVYAERLRKAGVIHRPARGRLRFMHATMRDWLRRELGSRSAAAGGSVSPVVTTTVKERIIEAHHETPEATHAAIAERVGTSTD